MCDGASEVMLVMAVVGAATTAVAANQQAKAEQGAINKQAETRSSEIAAQAAQAEQQQAQEGREARAQSAVAASASGINLGSNSFLASIQETTMNQVNNQGLIMENERNAQAGNQAEANSELASKASRSTFLGATLDVALAGAGGYMRGKSLEAAGANASARAGTVTSS
jgi:hypothetical protein